MFRHQYSKDSLSMNLTSFLDEFQNTPLHRKYAFYHISSSFFVNYWSTFATLSIIVIAILLFLALEFCFKKSVKLHSLLLTVLSALKWNVFLIIFSGSIGDIVFFTALDVQTQGFSSFYSCISLIFCVLTNILFVFVLYKILSTNWTLKTAQKTSEKEVETQTNLLRNFKALFDPYMNSSYPQQIFLFLFILRVSFANAIVGYFYAYPLFQAVCLVLLSLSMILYLIVKRPFKLLINLIQQVVLEICLLVANICVLILAIMGSKGVLDNPRRESIGQVIINLNIAVPIISLVLLAAKFLIIGIGFFKSYKAEKKSKNKLSQKIVHRIENKEPSMNVKLQSRLGSQARFHQTNLQAEIVSLPIDHGESYLNQSSLSLNGKQTGNSSLMNSPYFQNYSINNDASVLDKLNSSNMSEVSLFERRKPRIKRRFKTIQEFREYANHK